MTETAEREIEVVSGVIEGVTQKKPDTWQVEVRPDGSNYTKKLWTKDSELVGALGEKLGQAGAFVCSASYWTNQSGKEIRSLWINKQTEEGDWGHVPDGAVSDSPAPRAAAPTPSMGAKSPTAEVDWDAKERRDYRSRAWAQTISALTHTIKVDEDPHDIYRRLYALQRMIYRDIVRDLDPDAHEDDDVPF